MPLLETNIPEIAAVVQKVTRLQSGRGRKPDVLVAVNAWLWMARFGEQWWANTVQWSRNVGPHLGTRSFCKHYGRNIVEGLYLLGLVTHDQWKAHEQWVDAMQQAERQRDGTREIKSLADQLGYRLTKLKTPVKKEKPCKS